YQRNMVEIEELEIREDHSLYLRVDSLEKPVNPKHLEEMQYLHFRALREYGNHKAPLYDAKMGLETNASPLPQALAEGWVFHNRRYANSAYVVLLSKDGKYRYWANTNSQGYFSLFDLQQGEYWLQVITSNRELFFSEALTIKKGQR